MECRLAPTLADVRDPPRPPIAGLTATPTLAEVTDETATDGLAGDDPPASDLAAGADIGTGADLPDAPAAEDAGENVVDTNVDRFIDRMVSGSGGSLAGNAMIGMAKGMGLYKKVEIAAEVREGDEPEPDPDDPIEVTIDPAHPENTRIVFHVRADPGPDS